MAITKIQSESVNLTDNFAFTGTVTGVGATFSPRFSATLSSNQSIANTTDTKIAFNSENFDVGGCFNNTSGTVTLNGISTPSYSFAPNVAGLYFLGCKLFMATGTSSAYTIMYAYKNGNSRIIENQFYQDIGGARGHFVSTLVSMNGSSDSLNMATWHNAGSAKNAYGTLPNTHFFGYLLKAD